MKTSNRQQALEESIEDSIEAWNKRNQIEINKFSKAMDHFVQSENEKITAIKNATSTIGRIMSYV